MFPRRHLTLTEIGISEMELQDLNFKYKYKAFQVVLQVIMLEDHSTGYLRDMHKIYKKIIS